MKHPLQGLLRPELMELEEYTPILPFEVLSRRLGLPPERVVSTVAQHANTSAASVPLALSAAIEDGRVKPGQLVLMEGVGGGFTWAASLVRM